MIAWEGYGNMLDDKDSVQLCPINATGAMGKGLALTMRRAYPGLFELYRDRYHPDWSPIKDDYARATFLDVVTVGETKVLLFCTKVDWREASPLELVEGNLRRLAARWQELEIHQLAMPLVGTGAGRLPRPRVRDLVHEILGPIALPVRIYLGA
jgi:hypothetical protein